MADDRETIRTADQAQEAIPRREAGDRPEADPDDQKQVDEQDPDLEARRAFDCGAAKAGEPAVAQESEQREQHRAEHGHDERLEDRPEREPDPEKCRLDISADADRPKDDGVVFEGWKRGVIHQRDATRERAGLEWCGPPGRQEKCVRMKRTLCS